MNGEFNQKEKAIQLHKLHHTDRLLILPNVWDVLGARLLEDIGYTAIATASASIAFSNGYPDGEKIPFKNLLQILNQITDSVNLPVTADIESGYAKNDSEFRENIKRILETGIVGINIEDTNHITKTLNSVSTQCKKIREIREIANNMDIPLFINARADVMLYDSVSDTSKLEELIYRGLAYKEAGADCFFPIALRKEEDIRQLVTQIKMPVNILAIQGVPDLNTLNEIGVTRVSLGPGFLKIAVQSMKTLAIKLKDYNGLADITENTITSDYLKSLIKN